jgi:hypothetical protein
MLMTEHQLVQEIKLLWSRITKLEKRIETLERRPTDAVSTKRVPSILREFASSRGDV